jgi:hypothetical protein
MIIAMAPIGRSLLADVKKQQRSRPDRCEGQPPQRIVDAEVGQHDHQANDQADQHQRCHAVTMLTVRFRLMKKMT